MEGIIILSTIIVLFTGVGFIAICLEENKTPYEMYKHWLENKNWFGKFYTVIPIIIIFPAVIFYYISGFIFALFSFIYMYGLKDKEK